MKKIAKQVYKSGLYRTDNVYALRLLSKFSVWRSKVQIKSNRVIYQAWLTMRWDGVVIFKSDPDAAVSPAPLCKSTISILPQTLLRRQSGFQTLTQVTVAVFYIIFIVWHDDTRCYVLLPGLWLAYKLRLFHMDGSCKFDVYTYMPYSRLIFEL